MSNTDEIVAMATDIFTRADRDGNGLLSHKELKDLLHKEDSLRKLLQNGAGMRWKEFWSELDEDNDGSVSVEELEHLIRRRMEEMKQREEEAIQVALALSQEIFERADKDKNGWLSKKELKNLLHSDDDLRIALQTETGEHWKQFWAELDANHDGKIELPELQDYVVKRMKELARIEP